MQPDSAHIGLIRTQTTHPRLKQGGGSELNIVQAQIGELEALEISIGLEVEGIPRAQLNEFERLNLGAEGTDGGTGASHWLSLTA